MFNFSSRAPYFVVCLFACTLSTASSAQTSSSQPPTIGTCTVFPADNVWNTPVDQLPVSSYSASWVGTIGSARPLHPDFGSDPTNGMPVVTVSGSQAKLPAAFTYSGDSDPGPYAVPLTAPVEGGSGSTGDRHAIAIDTDNCILYEMWSAYPQAASWTAGSGAIFNLKSDALRTSGWTSADAAGLPVFPGLVRYDEVASGHINHALRFTVAQTQNTFLWPARHLASSLTGYQYPPMGARFRLRADFDISGFSAANQVILTALKKYGMIVADNGSSWFISGATDPRWSDDDLHNLTRITGTNFEAVDESSLMVDVNSGRTPQAATPTISINPTSASIIAGSTQQFTATLTNASSQAVTWSVNGIAGGNSTVGTVTSGGLYTAPSAVPSGGTVTVRATSTVASTLVAAAGVTITAKAIAAPVLSSLSPASGTQGTNVTVTLTGTNFQSGAAVAVTGSGISVTSANVVSASQIQAVLSIGSSATPGAHAVSVTTASGTSGAQNFTVNASAIPAPALASISPASGTQGTSITVTLTGTNFQSGAAVAVSGSGVTVSSVTVVSASQIQAVLALGTSATVGARSLTVITSSGTSGAQSFTVNQAAAPTSQKPALTSITPGSMQRGTTASFTLTGTNFASGITLTGHGSGLAFQNLALVNSTTITGQLVSTSSTPRQTVTFVVSNSAGSSNSVSLAVQ